MGIVNVTPDSFSNDGLLDPEAAVAHGFRLVDEGADLLDVGGESTRPGAAPVPAALQVHRVTPVIAALAAQTGVPISIDTSSAVVADTALHAGATIVNDVRGLEADPDLPRVVSRHGAHVILVHSRGGLNPPPVPEPGQRGARPGRPGWDRAAVDAVGAALETHVTVALAAGIARDRLILDPGIAFGKRVDRSLALLRYLRRLKQRAVLAGLPLLVGTSRKGFIGEVLGLPVDQRLEGNTGHPCPRHRPGRRPRPRSRRSRRRPLLPSRRRDRARRSRRAPHTARHQLTPPPLAPRSSLAILGSISADPRFPRVLCFLGPNTRPFAPFASG